PRPAATTHAAAGATTPPPAPPPSPQCPTPGRPGTSPPFRAVTKRSQHPRTRPRTPPPICMPDALLGQGSRGAQIKVFWVSRCSGAAPAGVDGTGPRQREGFGEFGSWLADLVLDLPGLRAGPAAG